MTQKLKNKILLIIGATTAIIIAVVAGVYSQKDLSNKDNTTGSNNSVSLLEPWHIEGGYVYYGDEIIPEADIVSFKPIGDGFSQDDNHIYFVGEKIYDLTASNENPLEKTASYLKTLVPKGDNSKAVNSIIASYYDLTLFYGNSSSDSFLIDEQAINDTYMPGFSAYNFEGIKLLTPVFRLAFIEPDSQASTVDFPTPTNGIGGGVFSKKLLDENTALVYGNYYQQESVGASADLCKESMAIIDKFVLKKINGEWKISELYPSFDSWQEEKKTAPGGGCEIINKEKYEKYTLD